MAQTALNVPFATAVVRCARATASAKGREPVKATDSAAATAATRESCVTAAPKATFSPTRTRTNYCAQPATPAARATALGPGLKHARPASQAT